MSARLLERQKNSFDRLVASGVYDVDFDHAPGAKTFVTRVLAHVLPRLTRQPGLTMLDCGCGTGAWLSFLHAQLSLQGVAELRLCGFDLSPRMVELAREKLQGLAVAADLRTGNLLERESYAFDGARSGFDLVFTYDVVQQLPRTLQAEACQRMVAALAPGGIALIFDNEADSRFGRRVALRKLLTRYCGLRLVPRYYCNAAYPSLERIRRKLENAPMIDAEVMVRADGVKRALIVERQGDLARGPDAGPAEWPLP